MASSVDNWVATIETDDESSYPTIREALSPEYADLSAEDIELLVESMYPEIRAEDLEGFFNSLKKFGKSVGRVAQRALPGVVSGATTGAALGPWGALAGGIAGGALSAATSGPKRSSGRRRGRANGSRRRFPSGLSRRLPGRGALAQLAGSPAATQLLRTLGRPQVTQAMTSLAMGGAGRRNVKVGNVSIPTGAITNTLQRLLERAEAELHEHSAGESAGTPLYLLDASGEFAVDPTDDDQRADRVLALLDLADHLGDREDDEREDDDREDDDDREIEYVGPAWSEEEEDDDLVLYEGVDFDSLEDDLD
jgi:hypothetical protein